MAHQLRLIFSESDIPLTYDELVGMLANLADPSNDCEDCAGGYPGAFIHKPNFDDSHLFITVCSTCSPHGVLEDTKAREIADLLGLSMRRRYDDETKRYWRPHLVRPGSPEDHDSYGVNADDAGCNPEHEIAC